MSSHLWVKFLSHFKLSSYIDILTCHIIINGVIKKTFTLRELAGSAGIKPRTVRSYIEKGLLRGPDNLGPGASYSEDHALRLTVIRTLREFGLTLGEIRRRLQPLGTEEVRKLAESSAAVTSHSPPGGTGERSSVDGTGTGRELRYRNLDLLLETLRDLAGESTVARGPAGEFWHRILVTPDIEFMVREGFSPEARMQLRKLADHIRFYLVGGIRNE